jgi:hypothetical protein
VNAVATHLKKLNLSHQTNGKKDVFAAGIVWLNQWLSSLLSRKLKFASIAALNLHKKKLSITVPL